MDAVGLLCNKAIDNGDGTVSFCSQRKGHEGPHDQPVPILRSRLNAIDDLRKVYRMRQDGTEEALIGFLDLHQGDRVRFDGYKTQRWYTLLSDPKPDYETGRLRIVALSD